MPGTGVEARRPREARSRPRRARRSTVSDVSAMSVDSTTTRRRPGGDGASAASCSASDSAPASGDDVDVARQIEPTSAASVRRISPMPGRNTSTSPLSSRTAVRTTSATACSTRARRSIGRQRTSTGNMRPALSIIGASLRRRRGLGNQPRRVRGGRHRQQPQVGPDRACRRRVPTPGRGRSGRLRSWTSSKITRPTPGNSGSCCRRRVSTPSVTTSIRVVDADVALVAGLVADGVADLAHRVGRPCVRRRRVARRRGSSITIRGARAKARRAGRAERGWSCRRRAERRSPPARSASATRNGPDARRPAGRGAGAARDRSRREGHVGSAERPANRGTGPGRRPSGSRRTPVGRRGDRPRRPHATRRGSIPRRTAATSPSTRMNTNAGSCARVPTPSTNERSGSQNTRNSSHSGPRNALRVVRVGGDDEVHPRVGAAEALRGSAPRSSGSTSSRWCTDRARRSPGGTW